MISRIFKFDKQDSLKQQEALKELQQKLDIANGTISAFEEKQAEMDKTMDELIKENERLNSVYDINAKEWQKKDKELSEALSKAHKGINDALKQRDSLVEENQRLKDDVNRLIAEASESNKKQPAKRRKK